MFHRGVDSFPIVRPQGRSYLHVPTGKEATLSREVEKNVGPEAKRARKGVLEFWGERLSWETGGRFRFLELP